MFPGLALALVSGLAAAPAAADPAAPLRRAMAGAESSLREGELERSESLYREVLLEGWLALGFLEHAQGRLAEAREAILKAGVVAADASRAGRALETVSARVSDPTPVADEPALRREITSSLVRAYMNLGVMQAQGHHFERAADLLGAAATLDPDFPRVQYALGVACFNAGLFERATGPLARVLDASPANTEVKTMLALAWVNLEAYDKAADLLRGDPERLANPSLQYAYGVSLVRSGHAAEAEQIFGRLLREHGDSAELLVVLGQASAQEGNYDAAIRALESALRLKPGVPDAAAALGVILLKQGHLPEAEDALRRATATQPGDVRSLSNLATVLEMQGRGTEALPFLRSALRSKPDFADARYLLGKILLAEGDAAGAVEHLTAAARVAPEDANVHYQLALAYQRLGRAELAEEEFARFRQLKDKARGRVP